MHWLTINPMKTTKTVFSVHLESEIPKPSMKEEKKRLRDLENPLRELVQDRQSLSEWQHPLAPSQDVQLLCWSVWMMHRLH